MKVQSLASFFVFCSSFYLAYCAGYYCCSSSASFDFTWASNLSLKDWSFFDCLSAYSFSGYSFSGYCDYSLGGWYCAGCSCMEDWDAGGLVVLSTASCFCLETMFCPVAMICWSLLCRPLNRFSSIAFGLSLFIRRLWGFSLRVIASMLEMSSLDTLCFRSVMRWDWRESEHWTLLDFLWGWFFSAMLLTYLSKWPVFYIIALTSRLKLFSESTSSCSSISPSLLWMELACLTSETFILLFWPFRGTRGRYGEVDASVGYSTWIGGR